MDVIKLIEKADDLVGKARADLDSYSEHSGKARAALYKVFEELRKVRAGFEVETGICRKCARQVDKRQLDYSFFCKACHDEERGVAV